MSTRELCYCFACGLSAALSEMEILAPQFGRALHVAARQQVHFPHEPL